MSAKRGHWALCRSRVVAFGKSLGLRVSVAVSPHAGATKTPLKAVGHCLKAVAHCLKAVGHCFKAVGHCFKAVGHCLKAVRR